jgi:hypothetical protein
MSNSTSTAPPFFATAPRWTFWASPIFDALDDVGDRGLERGVAGSVRPALDQDVLARGLLEPRVEDPLHAAGLAGPRVVLVDALRVHHRTEGEGDEDEDQPAERGGLPVGGAPAAHAGGEVARVLVSGHGLPPLAIRPRAGAGRV